ncbi:TetR family transcriptional regulator C-terminal domain-containing protein [Rhodococcus qingshengii]|uniref:TetR family transcriptional regulator C-terminal domain-containing protein n=1 Tax=Rhodococcus qingshengii TaxID=334542 RepID=UPI00352DAD2E
MAEAYDAASHYTDESCPGGCLIISAAISVTDSNSHIANRLRDMRNTNMALLSQRIAADIASGLLTADSDPEGLAKSIVHRCVIQGMSQRARHGATQRQLELVANRSISLAQSGIGPGSAEVASSTREQRPVGGFAGPHQARHFHSAATRALRLSGGRTRLRLRQYV